MVDWQLLVEEHVEGENIRCHQLQGDDWLSPLLETFKESYSKAVVLINTSDDYNLGSNFTRGLEETHLPVVVVTKSDGDAIQRCLEQGEMESEDVYARIEAADEEDEVDVAERWSVGGGTHLHLSPTAAAVALNAKKAVNVESSLSEITPLCACTHTHMNVMNGVFIYELPSCSTENMSSVVFLFNDDEE